MSDPVFTVFRNSCPHCSDGSPSKLHPVSSMRTLAYYQPFIDEDGRYHDHDANRQETDYKCSNGHRFSVYSKGYLCKHCNQRPEYYVR